MLIHREAFSVLYRKIDNKLQTCAPLAQTTSQTSPLDVCMEGKPFVTGAVTSPRKTVPNGRDECFQTSEKQRSSRAHYFVCKHQHQRAAIPFTPPTANTFRVNAKSIDISPWGVILSLALALLQIQLPAFLQLQQERQRLHRGVQGQPRLLTPLMTSRCQTLLTLWLVKNPHSTENSPEDR